MNRYNIFVIAAFVIVAIVVVNFEIAYFEAERQVEIPTTGFPDCLRIVQCSDVKEFQGIPLNEIKKIADNYNKCLEGFQLEQTCKIQVNQDIERFIEIGTVSER